MKENISQNKLNFELNKNLSLPNYVIKESDIYSIFEKDQKPSFITDKKIKADTFILSKQNMKKKCMEKLYA